jgi:hypothetical protein
MISGSDEGGIWLGKCSNDLNTGTINGRNTLDGSFNCKSGGILFASSSAYSMKFGHLVWSDKARSRRLMRNAILCLVVLLLGSFLVVMAATTNSRADGAFKKIQSLAGDWEGKDDHAMAAKTSFKVIVKNTTVMETLSMSGMEEMVTLYSLDGDAVSLIHYCPTNNQPHMQALPPNGPIQELVFDFKDVRNLSSPTAGHEQKLVLRFEDDDHITETWTWRRDGRDSLMTYKFSRKKPELSKQK